MNSARNAHRRARSTAFVIVRRPLASRIVRRRSLGLLAVTVVFASLVSVAAASSLSYVVTPKANATNTREYESVMTSTWRYFFTSSTKPKACTTAELNGKPVTVVTNFHNGRSSCSVPAGQPIYINEYGKQCSTMKGDHNGYGTEPWQIKSCAAAGIDKVFISVWIDGRNLGNKFGQHFWLPSPAFSVTPDSSRFPAANGSQVTAASWSWSLLFRKLPKGKHTVKCRVLDGTGSPHPRKLKAQSIVTLHVS